MRYCKNLCRNVQCLRQLGVGYLGGEGGMKGGGGRGDRVLGGRGVARKISNQLL